MSVPRTGGALLRQPADYSSRPQRAAEQNLILRHHGGAALPSSSVTRLGTIVKPPRPKKKSGLPESGGANPQWLNAVYRYWHHAEAVAHALLNHSNLRIVTNNLTSLTR